MYPNYLLTLGQRSVPWTKWPVFHQPFHIFPKKQGTLMRKTWELTGRLMWSLCNSMLLTPSHTNICLKNMGNKYIYIYSTYNVTFSNSLNGRNSTSSMSQPSFYWHFVGDHQNFVIGDPSVSSPPLFLHMFLGKKNPCSRSGPLVGPWSDMGALQSWHLVPWVCLGSFHLYKWRNSAGVLGLGFLDFCWAHFGSNVFIDIGRDLMRSNHS